MAETTAIAVFALGAGAATFFSPCAYALLPGYVGYYRSAVAGQSPPLSGVVLRGLSAAGGAVLTFGVLAISALLAGDLIQRVLPVLEPLVGVALIVLGIVVLWRDDLSVHVQLPKRRKSVIGFGLFGALYAVAATACVLPLFLAVAIQSLALPTTGSVVVLGAYAGSFASLMLGVTVATGIGYEVSGTWLTKHVGKIETMAGVLIIAAGVGQLYVAFWL